MMKTGTEKGGCQDVILIAALRLDEMRNLWVGANMKERKEPSALYFSKKQPISAHSRLAPKSDSVEFI